MVRDFITNIYILPEIYEPDVDFLGVDDYNVTIYEEPQLSSSGSFT